MRTMKKPALFLVVLLLLALILPAQSFAAGSTVDVSIPVEKIITGSQPASSATFTFELTANSAGNPMPANRQATITGAGSASFGPITYTEPNDYIYTIREVNSGVSNYTYDLSVYTVTVQITSDANGNLAGLISMQKSGAAGKVTKATFTNTYSSPAQPPDPYNPGHGRHYKTGDDRNNWIWYALIGAAVAIASVYLLIDSKKNARKRKEPRD